jgi:voltage-gated potassium channel
MNATEKLIGKKGNYVYMLIGLLVLIVLGPVVSKWDHDTSRVLTSYAFIALMLIGVWSLQKDKSVFLTGISLAAIGLLITTTNIFIRSEHLYILNIFISIVFCLLSIYVAITNILFSGSITFNKIVGSICIYLLIGVVWSLFYLLLTFFDASAFKGLENTVGIGDWNYIYFSFVTLTTLGYGDISPVNGLARALAYLEAVCGQFYMAVLVASLVSAHLVDYQGAKKNSE